MTRISVFRWGGAVAAVFATVVSTPDAYADVDLEFRPSTQSVEVGEVVRAGLYAVATDEPELVAAIDLVFSWETDDLLLLGLDETDAVPLLFSGFLVDDLFGLNEEIPPADGNGFYLAFAELKGEVLATPEGVLITTFEFEALQVAASTPITIESELQIGENPPGRTRVLSGDIPGLNVTGELRSATVEILEADPCPEDLDGSGAVDFGDILRILAAWGDVGAPEDLDGSGAVDFGDILRVLAVWGPCP